MLYLKMIFFETEYSVLFNVKIKLNFNNYKFGNFELD